MSETIRPLIVKLIKERGLVIEGRDLCEVTLTLQKERPEFAAFSKTEVRDALSAKLKAGDLLYVQKRGGRQLGVRTLLQHEAEELAKKRRRQQQRHVPRDNGRKPHSKVTSTVPTYATISTPPTRRAMEPPRRIAL